MRVFILVLILSFLFIFDACPELYVAIDGTNPKGVTSVKDEYLKDWEKDYTMIKVSEEYRGKHGWEIKYDGVKVRLATQQERDDYLNQQEVDTRTDYLTKLKQDIVDANALNP